MMRAMDCLQTTQREVRVDLSGCDIGVSQQRLHGAEVRAMLHHVGGATMPQHMRAGVTVRRLHE